MARMILSGVPVYTMDGQRSVCGALVVDGTRVGFAGSAKEAEKRYPGAESITLERGCVLPGFVDAHLHLREFSLLYRDLDLSGARDREEVLELVREAAARGNRDEWIIGGGADHRALEQLGRSDLDSIVSENPLVLYSRDMGTACVNTAVLGECHIDDSSNDPMGGRIERDAEGRPNGLLRDRAIDLLRRQVPEVKPKAVQDAILKGIDRLLSSGVTAFCDCSIYAPDLLMHTLMNQYRRNALHCRAVLMYDDRLSARFGSLGMQSLFGNEKVRLGGCKLILDGSLSSMTAAMKQPYGERKSTGMLLMEEAELHQILKRSYASYIWAAVHAVGDQAVEIALRGFERISKEVGVPKLLKRVEHAQTLNDQDISRFSEIGVIPVVNPGHIPFDRKKALAYLGPRARLQYRLASLLKGGATLAMGSDAPRGPVNPLYGMYTAVERKDFGEGPEIRFLPRERIGLHDALYAYTMGSAAALGLEGEIGSLEPGKYADLVVLSQDPFFNDPEALRDMTVQMTMVGGEIVYDGRQRA
jgi:predicted amidohydrolase YtcJ